MIDFKLPSMGADMDEGRLLEWLIKPGDSVKRGQVVAVVDTSKAAVEVESWQQGIVHELLVQPEQTIVVGTVMARFREPGETAATPTAPVAPAAAPPEPLARTADASHPPAPAPPTMTSAGARRVTPAARRRAAELRVDLARITAGTGPEGAITIADVEQLATRPKPPAKSDHAVGMRRAIAAAMSRSKREIPHYYLSETIPMRRAVEWLDAYNATHPITDRLLMAAALLKAVAICVKRFPELNGWYVDDRFQPAAAQHVGVAISLREGGLVAPALHDVVEQSMSEVMRGLTDLIGRARGGRLRSSELADATITVTNLGEQGVEQVQGVIYPPQVALVGFGRVHERAWAEGAALLAMPALTATLAADHRASDGHRGSQFLTALRALMQTPDQLDRRTEQPRS